MKKIKIALVLGLVFLTGLATGVVGTRIVIRGIIRRIIANPDLVRATIERDLTRKLKLDAAQREKVHEVLRQSQQDLRVLRAQTQPKFVEIFTNAEDQIQAVLRPEQQERWEKLKRENRQILPLPK